VLVADADGGAALGERTLRETLLAAEGVPADVDQERYAGALEEREVFALRAALVADGEGRAGCHAEVVPRIGGGATRTLAQGAMRYDQRNNRCERPASRGGRSPSGPPPLVFLRQELRHRLHDQRLSGEEEGMVVALQLA